MEKATREAQVNTSWTNPNEAYDEALATFVHSVLNPKRSAGFLADFVSLREMVCRAGAFTALSQQILKLTSPGVPDIYQGTEIWNFSLVDPDNRRPVDYAQRTRMLRELKRRKVSDRLAADLVESFGDGRIKLFATERTLQVRREHPDLFARGGYEPLTATGPRADHVFAFRRRTDSVELVVIAPRLMATLLKSGGAAPVGESTWGETTLTLSDDSRGARYQHVYTGKIVTSSADNCIRVAEALASFPAAVLIRTLPESAE